MFFCILTTETQRAQSGISFRPILYSRSGETTRPFGQLFYSRIFRSLIGVGASGFPLTIFGLSVTSPFPVFGRKRVDRGRGY